MWKQLASISLAVLVTACGTGQPITTTEQVAQTALRSLNYDWWLNFNDAFLAAYIMEGVNNNHDLRQASLKVDEYRQFVRSSFGQELPSVSANFSTLRIGDTPIPLKDKSILSLPLSVNYEVDLFGKHRLQTKSSETQLAAYELELKSTYIAFASDVATIYFNIVKLDKATNIQEQLLLIKRQLLNRALELKNHGLESSLEVNTVRRDYKIAQNQLSNLRRQRDLLLTQLAVILGREPTQLSQLRWTNYDTLKVSIMAPAAIASNVIFNRPDVLAVEQGLKKAEIDIRVARREFLPTFNITGLLLWSDLNSGGFFSSANTIDGLLGSIGQKLFTGGQLKANLAAQKIRYAQQLEQYKQVALQATKEVHDSLYNLSYDDDIHQRNLQNFSLINSNYLDYQARYRNGLLSAIDLLNYQQQLLAAELEAANSDLQRYIDYISIYKASGGKIIEGNTLDEPSSQSTLDPTTINTGV